MTARQQLQRIFLILCDKLTEPDNFIWQELKGMHDFHIWYLGFFNFAQIAFK